MSVIVRCHSCHQQSRVAPEAVGHVVACPRCPAHFVAEPEGAVRKPATIPVVYSSRLQPTPTVRHIEDIPTVHALPTGTAPIALALVPLGVPLLWLILTLTGRDSAFSFVAPVAIGLGMSVLGIGLANIRRWSVPTRIRSLVALVVLSYAAGALCYFAQPSWLERVREVVAVLGIAWHDFRPEDQSFQLNVPGEPQDIESPVAEWKLTAKQFVDPKNAVDRFSVAYGEAPSVLGSRKADDAWFETARDAIEKATGGKLLDEKIVPSRDAKSREYSFEVLAGKVKRIVRVVRTESKVYYLGVEGPFVSADRADVQHFLRSFKLTPQKK